MENENRKFWLHGAVARMQEQQPEGTIIVSSGVSPSGIYHVGHLREVLTADAMAWGLRQAGRTVQHIHFVDDFDAFRKVPGNIDPSFEQYLGTPLYLVPSPHGDGSYADYYLDEFFASLEQLAGILATDETDEFTVVRSHKMYASGRFGPLIHAVMSKTDAVREIIETVSGRQLKRDWSPIQILDAEQKLDRLKFVSLTDETTMQVVDEAGNESSLDYTSGAVKLDWRLDWPARWASYSVGAEPFGRDHATKGGSYDTGKELVSKVFDAPAPIPMPYEFINLKGQTKKMSASKGTGILPRQLLEFMPPALVRHFVLTPRPSLTLILDTGLGFGRMVDAFAGLERSVAASEADEDQRWALALARNCNVNELNEQPRATTDVPFNHLVIAIQTAQGDIEQAMTILQRDEEYAAVLESQADQVRQWLQYATVWLAEFAPEEVQFSLQTKSMPDTSGLNEAQQSMLARLAARIEAQRAETCEPADALWYHNAVHEVREEFELAPKEAFVAIYTVLLGKQSGPKAGLFLSMLDQTWLVARLQGRS